MEISTQSGNKPINPVVSMICGNLTRFGVPVRDSGMRMDLSKGEPYFFIRTDHTLIKMVQNFTGTAFTTSVDTPLSGADEAELGNRIEEFVKAYIAVMFIHTVLSEEDIEALKNGQPYCKNGIRTVVDHKDNSLYVTIFDSNNRRNDNLLQNYN